MKRRAVGAVAIMLLGFVLAGWGEETSATVSELPPAEKSGSSEIRTDLAPLTSRFPDLGSAESAVWMSGTMGSDRVPGPSTYWIDAVITLPPAEHTSLAELGLLAADSLPEGFSPELTDSIPASELRTSPELDEALSHPGFWSEVLLVNDGATLVLSTTFE